MVSVAVARDAMATRFEILLHGERESSLRAAAEEALTEVEQIEARLSAYRPDSEISRLNAQAGGGWTRLSPEVFALLRRAGEWHRRTRGAFDVTVGPLVQCWGFSNGHGRPADAAQLQLARSRVGMPGLEFDEASQSARLARPGMRLDLGAIGKGFAVERAVECLAEAGVQSALVHGGTSTVHGLGAPPGAEAWPVALPRPRPDDGGQLSGPAETALGLVALRDRALSVSAVWGRSFIREGRRFGHVLDPRTGLPVQGAVLAAVVTRSATDSDALSTALLVEGLSGSGWVAELEPDVNWLVAGRRERDGELAVRAHGIGSSGGIGWTRGAG